MAIRRGVIPSTAYTVCWTALLKVAAHGTRNRPDAAAGKESIRSATIGFLNGEMTRATKDIKSGYKLTQILLVKMAQGFAEQRPVEYAALQQAAAQIGSDRLIPGTVFSSAQINLTEQMGVHRDDSNMAGCYGAMTVIHAGKARGGWLVFPKYRVAVQLYNGDLLIADNHEAHGNTALHGEEGFERVSVVAYSNSSNLRELIQPVHATGGKLSIVEFGKQLLDTNDLDPVYVILWEARWRKALLQKWLLPYLAFYHIGTASWIASHDSDSTYWDAFEKAAGSSTYPRSSERRHYRAHNALKSVAYLRERGMANLFAPLLSGGPRTAAQVMEVVKTWEGFGDWSAFKAADMLERLGLVEIDFDLATAMYDSPKEGAKRYWRDEGEPPLLGKSVEEWAVARLLEELGHYKAPPRYERPIGLQEVETILCKHLSYLHGRYKLGEDIEACQKALRRFKDCDLAQRLWKAGAAGKLW
jgi:hypothetical protein